jgi:hypothetical protein
MSDTESRPTEAFEASVADVTVKPPVFAAVPIFNTPAVAVAVAAVPAFVLVVIALADDTDTRESTPAPSATTVASATRFEIVFVDMYFLSMGRSSIS